MITPMLNMWGWPAGCGSGPGTFTKGEAITSLDQIPAGTLVYCDNGGEPVPTTNIARVLRHCGPESAWNGAAAVCRFVDPDQPDRPRLAGDIEWLLRVEGDRSYFIANPGPRPSAPATPKGAS